METKEKAKFAFIALGLIGFAYFGIGYGIAPQYSLITDLDNLIPFVPVMIWPYLSFLILLFGSFFLIQTPRLFHNITWGLVTASFLASIVYTTFPTEYPREVLHSWDGLSELAIYIMHRIDPPTNNFPSLHVTFSWLIAIFLKKDWDDELGTFFIWWAILISCSVVLVKQHFVMDVLGGYMLARMTRYIVLLANRIYDKVQDKKYGTISGNID